jgi:hypothetical protein
MRHCYVKRQSNFRGMQFSEDYPIFIRKLFSRKPGVLRRGLLGLMRNFEFHFKHRDAE